MKISYIDRLKSLDKLDKYIELYHIPCVESCLDFINRFVMTYDPRKQEQSIQFELFPRQEEFISWLWGLFKNKTNGAVDKARDVGATWCFLAFSVWMFLFQGRSINLYSYKADAVHKKGDMNSLFGKVEYILKYLPKEMTKNITSTYMLIRRGESSITGLSGDEPRGGRASMLIKDETAFYEQAEKVEASLSEFADCIIDVSTHSGTNTIFYNKVSSGAIPVFIFEWFENPLHNQELYDKKREIAVAEGMLHIFEREINRNPMSSMKNVVIPNEYVLAARRCDYIVNGLIRAGLDIADEGGDTNALCIVNGNELIYIDEWGDLDPVETAKKAFWKCVELKVDIFQYDCIGLGASTRAVIRDLQEPFKIKQKEIEVQLKLLNDKRDKDENKIEKLSKELEEIKIITEMKIRGFNAGGKVLNPDNTEYGDKINNELFENIKAQVGFKLRYRFLNTFKFVNGKECNKEEVISFKSFSDNIIFNKFSRELSQPQHKLSKSGKIIIDKKPKGTKSPNLSDAFMICLAEIEEEWLDWTIF